MPEVQKTIFNLSSSYTVNIIVTSSFLGAISMSFSEIITKIEGIKNWVISDWKFPALNKVTHANGNVNTDLHEVISPGFDNHFIVNSDDEEIIEEMEIRCISLDKVVSMEANQKPIEAIFLRKKMSKNFRESMPINHLQEDALAFLKEISHLANLHHSNSSSLKSNIEWFSQAEHFHWMLHNNEDLIFKSPFKTNYDAYINYMNMLTDLKEQLD